VGIARGITEEFGRGDARYWLTPELLHVLQVNEAGLLQRRLAQGTATPSDIQAGQERAHTADKAVASDIARLTEEIHAQLTCAGTMDAYIRRVVND
jgi:hypothetical protein